MTAPTIAETLKYADLQMAAEALYGFDTKESTPSSLIPGDHYSGAIDSKILTTGNEHASRFTPTQAKAFVDQWKVVDHISNTTTGFSGTLFQAIKDDPAQGIKAGQYVLSIRSTEFIDDAVRDSYGTNKLEVKDHGWAFGQISDMEAWYAKLRADGTLPAGAKLDVTGYSLGGHLATAFNLLRREEAAQETQSVTIGQVVTFNGAGVGQIKNGASLTSVITLFKDLRASDALIESKFSDRRLAEAYQVLRQRLSDGHTPGVADYDLVNSISNIAPLPADNERFRAEQNWLISALDNIKALKDEVAYTAALNDTKEGQPAVIPETHIAQEGFDYQVAMQIASAMTYSKGAVPGILNGLTGKSYATPVLTNQYDIVGRETTTIQTALVSDSQWHYGKNVDLFIEDQPLTRGGVSLQLAEAYWDTGALHPLQQYTKNDFGDTHSLVLIVDSLNIQNTLLQLIPEGEREEAAKNMNAFLKAASCLKADRDGGQGKAEGDVLERILDALSQTLMGADPKLRKGTAENGDSLATGGTYSNIPLRKTFYERLEQVQKSITDNELAGKFTLSLPDASLADNAHKDFASLLSLLILSPVAIKAGEGGEDFAAEKLGLKWADEYTAWTEDKNQSEAQRGTGISNYTDQYLKDRAAFLAQISEANLANTCDGTTLRAEVFTSDAVYFKDETSGIGLQEQNSVTGNSTGPKYVFGGTDNETLWGTDKADHLYGGAGMDRLDGGKGDDYLEGNVGGDTFTGGKGNDTLIGGKGLDIYIFKSGDGWDLIEDQDGQGALYYDDIELTGGDYVSPNTWQKKDESSGKVFTYILIDWTSNNETYKRLVINGPDGGLRIERWQPGQLGLILPGAPADTQIPTPSTQRQILGDLKPIDTDTTREGWQYAYDDLGNVLVEEDIPFSGRADTLYDSVGNDLIRGEGGHDIIRAERGGNDTIYAGSGDDWVNAGADADHVYGEVGDDLLLGGGGKDTLEGQSGKDMLLGGEGDDGVFAEGVQGRNAAMEANEASQGNSDERGEWLDGGDNDDLVVGSNMADLLLGGAGKDDLFGGAGNDNLWGDMTTDDASRTWTLVREVETTGHIRHYKSIISGAELHTPAGGNDHLFGGAGDDWIMGDGGDDFIDGGIDNDVAFGGEGNDVVMGKSGDDSLSGDELDEAGSPDALPGVLHGYDFVDGGDGNDRLYGNGASDELLGGAGNDELSGDDGVTPGQYHGKDILDGGSGDDKLWGGGDDDEVVGGDGNDYLEGDDLAWLDAQYHGKDTLRGGKGNDTLFGGGKDDVLYGGDGADSLAGDGAPDKPIPEDKCGNDQLFGEKGEDYLEGGAGNDLLDGGADNDILEGGIGDDTLLGGLGADSLTGGAGNDQLVGGVGADAMDGGAGDDEYRLSAGDGLTIDGVCDSITDNSGNNKIVFSSASLSETTISSYGGGAYLRINYGGGDSVFVEGGYAGSVRSYEFSGGERLGFSELIGRLSTGVTSSKSVTGTTVIVGGYDNNSIVGVEGESILSGGAGNDVLSGSGGGNTYLYGLGDGTDQIVDTSKANGFLTENTLRFGSGITLADIKLGLGSLRIQVGPDLSNAIHIDGFTPDDALSQHPIDRFEFADGVVLTYEQLLALGFDLEGTAGDDVIRGTSVTDRIVGGAGNDQLEGGDGDDRLIGAAGDDVLSGGVGSDTYVWGIGAGKDLIDNSSAPLPPESLPQGKVDALVIDGSLLPENLVFVRSGNDLIVRVRATDDQITVVNHFAGAPIDALSFSDGSTWTVSDIEAHLTNELTSGADIYVGTEGDDNIDGQGGDDNLNGMAGNDILVGGAGRDVLVGGAGSDTLDGRGDGTPDLMQGDADGDVYLFGRGSGTDVVQDSGDVLSNDVIRLDSGISPSDILLQISGNDLVLKIVGTSDQITIVDGAISTKVERIEFSDATVWYEADIRQQIINGAATSSDDVIVGFDGSELIRGLDGNDTLNGLAGDDVLIGGSGTDSLSGDAGADTLDGRGDSATDMLRGGEDGDVYLFGRGSGSDSIVEIGDISSIDTIRMDADISPSEISVKRVGNDLILQIAGTADRITVMGAYATGANAGSRIERIEFFDSTVWTAAELNEKILTGSDGNDVVDGFDVNDVIHGMAGNDTVNGFGGDDTLWGDDGRDLLNGGDGDDTLDGGASDDNLAGGLGSDVYHYARGSGIDSIFETGSNEGDIDVVLMGPDILPSDIVLTRYANSTEYDSLRLSIKTSDGSKSPDYLNIVNFFSRQDGYFKVEKIQFANGASWDTATISTLVDTGTDLDDVISGDRWDNVIDGGKGNDLLYGYAGNDTLAGGSGNDLLYGGTGDDVYRFGRDDGSDMALEDGGVDTLELGGDISDQDVTLYRNGSDLVVVINESANQLRVRGFFSDSRFQIEQIRFSDMSVWNSTEIASRVIAGAVNSMTGTVDNDVFNVDHELDVIVEAPDQGVDAVRSSVSWSLGENIENLELTGVLNINGTGNALNNTIIGNLNSNRLDGRGGADVLIGGAGDDVYYTDDGDVIVESLGGGVDTLISRHGFTLMANVENGKVSSEGPWPVRKSSFYGNELDNVIEVREGDIADGREGADTIIFSDFGMWNSGVYYPAYEIQGSTAYVDNSGDKVIFAYSDEALRSRVITSIDRVLDQGVGMLELASGSSARTGTGNNLDNFIQGNESENTLLGAEGNDTLFGGAGADTLLGGRGNDTYYLDSRRTLLNRDLSYLFGHSVGDLAPNEDAIVEMAGEGVDTIYTPYDLQLPDNVENLVLETYDALGSWGSYSFEYALRGTGNSLDNQITGNAGDNVLDGGAGADLLDGKVGNDTYIIDNIGDVIIDSGGVDTVVSSVSYSLSSDIENITLTGADTVAATGNGGNNLLDGSQNSAANQLIGGLGDDTYILGNGDAVLEFSNEGLDTVVAGESYVAGNNIENVRLTGELAVSATGNASNNVLDGSQNTSANLLSGQGGDDTYVVGVGDLIDEAAGGGIDTVVSTIASYTLQANLENLTIEASAGSATGVGNSLDNLIIGNAFDNRLDGAQGADTMRGGSGNDVYVVDNIGDVIEDNSGQNTVEATISYALSEGVASLVLLGTDAIHGNGNALSNTLDGSQNSAANQLAGGAGNDRYVIGDGDTVVESANEGIDTIVTAQSTLLGDNIENLELRGQQDIDATGNALDNMLWGNDGSNVLDGAGGSDVMVGRGGDDTYIVNSAGDQVFEEAGGGIDTVNSAVSFVLGESFENLTLTGVDAINGTGNSRDNVLRGNSGANLLQGGQGNDTYHVGSGDVVVESASEGADTVISAVGRTLESNVENLILVGDASIDGTGNESHNLLSGNAGNNRLDGLGGNDTMAGGLGDDIYVVDSGLDVVVESADAGIDTVESAETYVLGDNVENLILTGNGYASGTGNALDNSITGGIGGGSGVLDGGAGNDVITARGGAELHGGQGNDRLYGSAEYDLLFGDSGDDQLLGGEGNDYLDGGAGSDAMIGGAGDDNYFVDAESDTVSEEATGGNDVVNATANYQLAENVETLYLAGTGNIDGIGNSAANTIYGNAGNNRLDGRGGADQLSGGGGSDTYVVDNLADSIIDYQVDDNDTVESSIDWSLDSFQENLTLVGNLAINGTGNVFDNRIVGNSADNVLDGGTGNDTYFFSIGGGHDTIQEVADNTSGKNNVLRLGAGITPNDVILSRVGDDLEVAISGTDDRVTVRNFCLNNDVRNAENPVQQIVFADNTVWDLQLIQHLIFANHFPTGEVAISGSPIQNEMLSVTNSLADVDGMGPISYQWQMSTDGVIWSDIGGETGTTLMLQEAHVGHQIRVSANYSDGLGLLESLASASTSVVGNVNDAPQGGLSILGDAVRNQVISISNNIADVDGIEQVSYRWQQSADGSAWVDISQANAESFTLTDGLVGQQIRVVASYVDGHGTPESVVSKAKLVLAAPNHAPVFLGGTGIPGVVVNDAGSTEDWLYGVDVQADGKYVVTGKTLDADGYPDFAIYRYNADGALDTTFNGTGKVTTALGAFNDEAYGVHVLQDGKILVGGFSSQGATDFALARYNADGSLDPSFGGDGKVTANINVYWDQAYSMAVQSDGKIVLAGMATGNPTNTQVLAVARFNDDGSLDTSFNGNGKALISAGYTNQYLQSVKLQEDGKIVTAGFGYNQGSGNYDLVLLRFNQNGTLDTSFNEDGIVTNDSATSDIARSLAIQSDGKVLVFGTSVNGACIWRYNVNGSLDASFGTSGRVDVTVGSWSYGDSLTLDSEGKILISGYLNRSETGLDVAVARYLANGSLDTQFGDNGIATVATSTNVDSASALRLLQDGRILVVGGRYASDTDTDMIVARFSANGVLDESFGSASRIADQAAIKGTPFTFTLPSGLFADPDDGDSLVYSASLADGSALPGWLKFDNATLTFSGTPTAGAIGISELRVTATDMADQSASSNVFRLSVAFVNSAPGGTLSVAGIQRQYETLTAVSTLTDEDGLGPYTYQWQSSSGEDVWTDLSGMTSDQIVLSESVVGKQLRVKISYVDGFGSAESVTSVATSSVMNVNDAPLLVAPISDKIATQGVAFSAAVALNAFADPDAGDVLSYTASLEDGSPLPSWLTFDPVNRQFHGVPTDAGSLSVRIIATDSGGMTASDVFLITIEGLDKTLTGTAGADTLTGNIGNDTLSGLDGNDTLNGLDGNDYLDGGTGNDKMIGGAGDDVYIVGSASDTVTELSNGGSDTVRSSVTYTLAANVETLVLTGTTAINATGNALSNTLTGNSAKNTLDGGSGADVMSGGVGDDTYIVDNAGDVVIENANEGSDTIQSSVTYTLGMNQEKLTLTGSASINGTGNELANTLTGNAANNILDGGFGNDSLAGGAGNDTYIVSTGDTISEAASAGTDTVISDITWTLGSNLENLTLTGTAAINGTGNTLNNILIGNSAANTLSGGTGADTMQGGAGDDTYVVDNAGDVVTEASNAGVDLVKSSVTYTLSNNVENLTLTGTTAINGVGNTLNNILTGNSANNTLTGGAGNDTINGGSGNDTMLGGQGDDTYYVNVATDVVTENASEGFDSVYSTVTLTLAANAEALFMNGTSAINGTGNALNNLVRGNTAANTLNGGTGNDVLEGGAGNDILTDTAGTALFNGGAGTDTLTGGAAAEIFLGGLGKDTYTTAGGNDIVLFNKGDGQDTFAAGGTGSDIISLGGSINYADLTFSKSSNDLVLKLGGTDQITFKNWYASTPSKPVATLQVIAEAMSDFAPGGNNPLLDQKVENFNFAGLVNAFDAARTANTGLTSWALTNALTSFQLAGSDTAALGGDLAYQYGKNGTLAGIGVTPALGTLSDSKLGSTAQTLTPLSGLQTGTVRLS